MPTMEQNHCSQCNESAGPLLACDDSERSDKPGLKARFCNNCMMGKKVKVFWPVDESWYTGVVQEYNDKTGEHLLKYPDGDTEWVKIGDIMQANADAEGALPPGSGGVLDPMVPVPPGSDPLLMVGDPSGGGAPPVGHAQQEDARKWQGMGGPYSYAPGGPYPPPQSGYPPAGAMAYGSAMQAQHMQHYGMYGHGPPPGSAAYSGGPPAMYAPAPPYGSSMSSSGIAHHSSDAHMNKGGGTDTSPPDGGRRKTGPKPWPKEEDALLMNLVHSMQYPIKWTVIAQSLHGRTGKQCRERYVNHLNPRLKNTDWTPVEDSTIFHLYNTIGSHWAKMSKVIPGRTDNNIKNRFHNIRRQYEREDTHRMRLSAVEDFPDEIRLDRLRTFPEHLAGKATDLWDMKSAVGVLAAQSVLGDNSNTNRNMSRFGPFATVGGGGGDNGGGDSSDSHNEVVCVRCGFLIPSVHTGTEVCTKTGWCQSCARVPPNVSGNLLRECLNLRRADERELRDIIESWQEFVVPDQERTTVSPAEAQNEATGGEGAATTGSDGLAVASSQQETIAANVKVES